MRQRLRIATRASRLALWQAQGVKERLVAGRSGLEVELVRIRTSGDKFLDVPLSRVGGKGLFVKEIEEALLQGRADIAVHSLKDLPAELAGGLVLAAVPAREDPRDVLVTRDGATLEGLAAGTLLGTSSLRRQALLLHRRPDLRLTPLRGNVETRLRKLREGAVDATVLALAGLKRLGISPPYMHVLDEKDFLPAIGQGALAIETRVDDIAAEMVRPLHDPVSAAAVAAERAFLRRLSGSCQLPLAARAEVREDALTLEGLIASPDGQKLVRGRRTGRAAEAEAVGAGLAAELLGRGGAEILREIGIEADG